MADTDVIIIGAGVAGLTCGCLLAKKGLKVLMIEKNPKVGGCCSSFHAPKGKSTLCLSYKAPYHVSADWGKEIRDQLCQSLIAKASAFIPDLRNRIMVSVETTPKTIEGWTHNRWGAAYGWAQIPSQSGIHRLQRTTPAQNLYLTGHWTSPGGGIAGVVASGELTAETVLSRL